MVVTNRLEEVGRELEEIDKLARNIKYFNIMFGNKDEQLKDYAKIQLIFAMWRRELPKHYKPLIEFYQGEIDIIAENVKKPTLVECVKSYRTG